MSSLYDIHKCIEVNFIPIFEYVIVGKACVTNHVFQKFNTLSWQSVTAQCASVTRALKKCYTRGPL
jgi:hypothetical protein